MIISRGDQLSLVIIKILMSYKNLLYNSKEQGDFTRDIQPLQDQNTRDKQQNLYYIVSIITTRWCLMDERKEFEKAFLDNRGKIYCMIGRYISDVCTIEDLTQHTFMKAWIDRHNFRGDSSFSTWLCNIAINSTINYVKCKKNNKKKHSEYIDCFPSNSNVVSEIITNEEIAKINAAIANLPHMIKDCVILFAVCDLSYEAIAKKLNVPIGTVRSRIHRGRFYLRKALEN